MVIIKHNPCNGEVIAEIPEASPHEVCEAIDKAREAQPAWGDMPAVERGNILNAICQKMDEYREEIAKIISLETGKSMMDALHETASAIALGRFFAGEGQRLYGRTSTSGTPNRWAMTVRQPCGVAGLITAFNMPIANVAWKVFPALICGNSVVLKPSEYAPMTAITFEALARQNGLPDGVLNVVQGGVKTGECIVFHHRVDVISFTGSSAAGMCIGKECATRHVKVSLEMGGKNPFVVCDDADFPRAVKWAIQSVFSLSGQRCASASRIIVFNNIYERFKDALLAATPREIGPVINEKQIEKMLNVLAHEVDHGAQLLIGGHRMKDEAHRKGYYMAPTLLENSTPEIARADLFGPIATLHRANDLEEALSIANDSLYGLTACIHTKNIDRALQFASKVQAGVVSVNAGTYGSEPHMPFGGLKQSGNGIREPGTEALDVYSNLKTIYLNG